MDTYLLAEYVKGILETLGEDPRREGLERTPARVAIMYGELTCGYTMDPRDIFTSFEEKEYRDLVFVSGIPFYSLCEHHMLPFFGKAHIGYIPNGRIIGLSKLARLVNIYARRLQVQERLTYQVANDIMTYLQPAGAMVVLQAEHLCMAMRGVEKPGTITTTSAVRGNFETDSTLRSEFLSLLKGDK